MSEEQRCTFRRLQQGELRVARAWTLKERIRRLCQYRYFGAAQKFFARRFWWATRSRLRPMAEVAKLMRWSTALAATVPRCTAHLAKAWALNSQWSISQNPGRCPGAPLRLRSRGGADHVGPLPFAWPDSRPPS
jgi:hypothetical protein